MLGIAFLTVALGAPAFDHTHRSFDELLQKHVQGGAVRYGALRADGAALAAYTASLARAPAASFSRDEALAFYINAYNAFTLQLILRHPGVASIRDIDEPWDKPRFTVAGESRTLNGIEHEIIRKRFGEPLIHMVLVCAAKSCPPLESRAFTAVDLGTRLNAAAERFARDPRFNELRVDRGQLEVSQIFEWYGQDFIDRYAPGQKDPHAAIRGFFANSLARPIGAEVKVTFKTYDWRLNGTW